MQIVAFEQASRYVGSHGYARYSKMSALLGIQVVPRIVFSALSKFARGVLLFKKGSADYGKGIA